MNRQLTFISVIKTVLYIGSKVIKSKMNPASCYPSQVSGFHVDDRAHTDIDGPTFTLTATVSSSTHLHHSDQLKLIESIGQLSQFGQLHEK